MKQRTNSDKKLLWSLSLIITDGSDTIKSSLSSEILQTWLGVDPLIYLKMSDEGKNNYKDSEADMGQKLGL